MMNIGILGCSEIAYRRFMPAVLALKDITVKAVAEEYDPTKLEPFCEKYALEGERSFEELINRNDIGAVYIPQPPSLHFRWAKRALECGKHVLIEKPSTTEYSLTKKLVDLAKEKSLALHENYMFQYHSQVSEIQKLIQSGVIGNLRLIRANFGFPMRKKNDFRYNAELGGGALLDAGGYALKLATIFLGDTVRVDASHLSYISGFEVDMYGNASLSNEEGLVCQIGFGMDCQYQCCMEMWGSQGRLYTDRIFTAPPGYEPTVIIEKGEERKVVKMQEDSHFQHSIEAFCEEITDKGKREKMYHDIVLQSKLVDSIRNP